MKIKVLVVDDSSFFRRRVSEIINADPDMEVIDTAKNGQEAITKAKSLRPDVITMDIEMPVLDGISAVKAIMADNPTPILMFSSLTHQGAKSTLDALEAGAANFLPKKFEDIAKDKAEAVQLLQQNIKAISRRRGMVRPLRSPSVSTAAKSVAASQTPLSSVTARTSSPVRTPLTSPRASASVETNRQSVAEPRPQSRVVKRASGKKYNLLAIGSSTGGPVALQNILTQLDRNFPLPILLIQHMPSTFTAAFAARLNTLCKIQVKEAQHGDRLQPGVAYLAPGGKQVLIDNKSSGMSLKVVDSPDGINYKPSVDITFGSTAQAYRDKVLAVVLTGMGADGRDGSKLLRQKGSTIWAQDAESCVVYGMPQAVVNAGLSHEQISLDQMAERIMIEIGVR